MPDHPGLRPPLLKRRGRPPECVTIITNTTTWNYEYHCLGADTLGAPYFGSGLCPNATSNFSLFEETPVLSITQSSWVPV